MGQSSDVDSPARAVPAFAVTSGPGPRNSKTNVELVPAQIEQVALISPQRLRNPGVHNRPQRAGSVISSSAGAGLVASRQVVVAAADLVAALALLW